MKERSKNILKYIKKKYIFFILILLILLQVSQLLFYIINADTNPSYDEAWHLTNALFYRNHIFGFDNRSVEDLTQVSSIFYYGFSNYTHPNFFYLISSLFPINYDNILFINIIFVIILILATYGIGKELFGKNEGLFAAFLVTMYPSITGISHDYFLDLPLASIVALSVYFLIKSENQKKFLIFFIITSILGIMTKKLFLFFIGPPVVYFMVKEFSKKEKLKNKKILIGCSLLILGGIFYLLINNESPLTSFFKFAFNIYLNDFNRNFINFINYHISFLYFILFLIGLILFTLKGKNRAIGFSIIFPLIILITSNHISYVRRALPIFYAIALITSAGTLQINKSYRKIIISFIIILGVTQFFLISFHPLINENIHLGNTKIILIKKDPGSYLDSSHYEFVKPLDYQRTNITKILDLIEMDSNKKEVTICNIGESIDVSWTSIFHYVYLEKRNVRRISGNGCDPTQYNYVIIKGDITDKNSVNPEGGSVADSNRRSQDMLRNNDENFELIGKVSEIYIYKKL